MATVESHGVIIDYEILNPERTVSEDAFRVHGFSDTFLKNKPITNRT